nr:PREDICTED: endothelial lipase-like [Linepithema humile]
MTTNMETRVLIGFLLACTVAGFPVEEAIEDDKIFTPEDYTVLKNTVAYVYDDNENLVRVTFEENDDDGDIIDKNLEDHVFFFLYTKKNPNKQKNLYVNDDDALANSDFDFSKPTRFITHGWINSRDSKACTLIRDAYIKHDDYNIIVVDWSKISKRPYVWASKHVKVVGEYVATMIDFLHKRGMDLSQTILIGHSLGAHVVGLAGYNAKDEVETVIGLDPALPGFRLADSKHRISTDSAKYVEIIHTNGGHLGFLKAIGDADFYPNGGRAQPGCGLDPGGACSHARAYRFFAESLTSQLGFHGRNCTDFGKFVRGFCDTLHTSIMGGHKRLFHARGKYYLITKTAFPFANGPFAKVIGTAI